MSRGDMRGQNAIPSGGAASNIQAWKERLAELEEQNATLEQENLDLQSRLDEIGDIAAPERAQADERIDRIEKKLDTLIEALSTLPELFDIREPALALEMKPQAEG